MNIRGCFTAIGAVVVAVVVISVAVSAGHHSTATPTAISTPSSTSAGATDTPTATDTPAPAVVATNPTACTAIKLASASEWSQAETHWLTVESAASGNDVTTAYQLLTDTEAVAMDKLNGTPSATDIATYNSDLASSGFTAGC